MDYQLKKEDQNARQKAASKSARDLRPNWPVQTEAEADESRKRRDAGRYALRVFLETYFPNAFTMVWSDDQLKQIDRMQDAILNGGLQAMAAPRGDGKTTRCERAAIWALLYRHRRFVSLIGATERHAEMVLAHIKRELDDNELLMTDFRHVCYPIRRLENNGRLRIGQIIDGAQTQIEWSAKRVAFPIVPDKFSSGDYCVPPDMPNVSGSVVSVSGITGALRGQSHVLPTGEIIRPDFVMLDDPQDRESAMSPSQCAERVAIVNGDVLGMAGPGKKISAFMPCTVIRQGDMADTFLDQKASPRWHGQRCKLIYSLPSDEKLWEKYARLRADSFRQGGNGSEATEFYRANRAAMDAGALAAWPARFNADELSAIQHAMNLKIDDEHAFAAEYQNEPLTAETGDGLTMTAERILKQLSGLDRGIAPAQAEYVTAFIDVHDTLLYWAVCGWSAEFDGWLLDYGSWPDQSSRYFVLRKAARTLARQYPGTGVDAAIRAGLIELTNTLAARTWEREDGARLKLSRGLIDAGYKPQIVYNVCDISAYGSVVMPSRGVGIGAAGKPMTEYVKRQGDRIGFNWYIPAPRDKALRHFRFDSNFWKAFVWSRLGVAVGDCGALSLYGNVPDEHRMLADHIANAETAVRTIGQGRVVDEFRVKPDRPDNHLFDCVVGCAAAASLCGAAIAGIPASVPKQRKKYTQGDVASWRTFPSFPRKVA